MFFLLYFRWVKNNQKLEEEAKSGVVDTGPKLDLGFKAGQTITLNIAGVSIIQGWKKCKISLEYGQKWCQNVNF